MSSPMDDQQLSPMQSTSEFGDSKKELRQELECCVHGRPCIIASKLSRHTGRRVERLCLSKTLDVPSSIGQVNKLTTSKKSCDEYEMMLPTTVTPRLLSKEQAVWTARTPGSMELPPSVEAYIGVLTAKQAEKYVMKPASFKLYHMVIL